MIAPLLHEVNVFTHTFFVPIRLLDEDFEEQLTGGPLGPTLPENVTFKKWEPTVSEDLKKHTLWDALGFPLQLHIPGWQMAPPYPVDWPRAAYNLIYNEYYRDQNLQAEVSLENKELLRRAWAKDYFTSALPSPQRGTPMALPITGTAFADFMNNNTFLTSTDMVDPDNFRLATTPPGSTSGQTTLSARRSTFITGDQALNNIKNALSDNVVNLATASTFDVNDLRAVVQMQRWMERNMRAGVRYTEFLQARWNVAPRDDRLQRPEYIGGSKSPLIISEVLQTSESSSQNPQGTMAGHGLAANIASVKTYKVQEFGIIITLMSIMPKAMYGQGMDRQWLMETRYDIPFPEFTHLGEREIMRTEIYSTTQEAINRGIFGFRGIFDEHRSKLDRVSGDMRDLFDYWHLGRKFPISPELNANFIAMHGEDPVFRRIFASQSEPGFICSIGNRIKGIRPLPVVAEPGLMDHF